MILVTGGTGLVGSSLLFYLCKYKPNKQIFATKRKYSDMTHIRNVFTFYDKTVAKRYFEHIRWIDFDITNGIDTLHCIKDIETIYHCAGFVSFKEKDRDTLLNVNWKGTKNIVQVCLKYNIKLVYISSTASIGKEKKQDTYTEKDMWSDRKHIQFPYVLSKYLAEQEVLQACKNGLSAIIVNPGIILGPGNIQQSSLIIFKHIQKGLPFYTKGVNGFVDVRDICNCIFKLENGHHYCKRYILISDNISFEYLFRQIAKGFQKKIYFIPIHKTLMTILYTVQNTLGIQGTLTKQSIKSSQETTRYSNTNIISTTQHAFIPIEQTISDCCNFFKNPPN